MGNLIGEILRGDRSPLQKRDSVIYLSTMHAVDWIAPIAKANTGQQTNANIYANYSPNQIVSEVTTTQQASQNTPNDLDIIAIRQELAEIQKDEVN